MSDKSESGSKRRFYTPRSYRAASHHEAHAAEGAEHHHPLDAAPIVTTNNELAALIDRLRTAGVFAYDSEFIGELTYIPKLCLIQVATADEVALIDPLAEIDLTPFWELICDASVLKIVHAGMQDIEPVTRHTKSRAQNIFDTQVAAGFIGLTYPTSLSKLVHEMIGVKLGKGLTFTHWDQRPLSNQQLRYAADDVRYLPAVHEKIAAQMQATGHADWAKEEFDSLCDPALYIFDPETDFLRVRGSGSLPPTQLAVLRELANLREEAAKEHNIPSRAFLRDEVLIDLAKTPIKTVEKLGKVRGLPRPVEIDYGTRIVEATLRALALPKEKLPESQQLEITPREKFSADALWAATQSLCIGLGIDPNLVTSRQEVGEFYRHLAHGTPAPKRLGNGWRKRIIADRLAELFKGSKEIRLAWREGNLRAE